MSEPQPGPGDAPGAQGRPTPQSDDTQPERARPQPEHVEWYRAADNEDFDNIPDEDIDFGGNNKTDQLPVGSPGGWNPGVSGFGGGYAGGGYPGGGYPGVGFPGVGFPGGPGGGFPGGPGGPGGSYPGAGYPGSGYVGGYPVGGYPGSGYPAGMGYPAGSRRSGRATAALVALVALVAAGIGAGIAYAAGGSAPSSNIASSTPGGSSGSGNPGSGYPGSGSQGPQYGNPGTNPGSGSAGVVPGAGSPSDVSAIAAKVDPDLVDINVEFQYQGEGGAGTGIVLTSNGEVLTNNHVVDGATSISVTDVGNGKTYGATVLGYDPIHDMAVIQLTGASGLQTATISQSAPAVGEGVVAIGNAGGTGGTPTAAGGSITGLDQSIAASDEIDGTTENLTGLIQTNADVQEGDSGGPLVNSAGEVVGMDTAALTQSPQSQGSEGYAIPISQAIATARQIKAGDGSADVHVGATAFLGITVSTSYGRGGGGGFPGQGQGVSGAEITGLVSGGAAEQAGLQAGDVITSLDGQNVSSYQDVTTILIPLHPGDSVEIGWTDTDGQTQSTTITLGSGPPA